MNLAAVAVGVQAALQEAGNAAAAELAAVRQQHAAAVAALEVQLTDEQHSLAAASQQVLELSTQLAQQQQQQQQRQSAFRTAEAAADDGSVSLDAGFAPCQQQQQQQQQDVQPVEEGPAAAAATAPDDTHHGGGHGGSCSVRQHAELLSLLAERDAALARMGSELAVARAALEGQAELPGEEGAVTQVCRGVWRGGGVLSWCVQYGSRRQGLPWEGRAELPEISSSRGTCVSTHKTALHVMQLLDTLLRWW